MLFCLLFTIASLYDLSAAFLMLSILLIFSRELVLIASFLTKLMVLQQKLSATSSKLYKQLGRRLFAAQSFVSAIICWLLFRRFVLLKKLAAKRYYRYTPALRELRAIAVNVQVTPTSKERLIERLTTVRWCLIMA